jgi:monofunctional biosynthetic peptidoglycan transglycosylase
MSRVIVSFEGDNEPTWQAVDDRVMGGTSSSRLWVTPGGTGVFEGRVSLEHGGGFALVRAPLRPTDLSSYDGLELRVLGDGKPYRLRLRMDPHGQGVVYQYPFPTQGKGWETLRLPFSGFEAVLRGRRVPSAGPLDTKKIGQIGLMISRGREEEFRLELGWIRAYADSAGEVDEPSEP